jgi:cell division transport system permease protein
MSVRAKAVYFWRSALHGMSRQPFVNAIAILSVAIALFALGLTRSLDLWLQATVAHLGSEVQLTVFLSSAAGPEEVDAVSEAIRARTGTAPTVITPEDALARLRSELNDDSGALEHLPENPLPTSLEVKIPEKLRDPTQLGLFASELRARSEVTSVDYGEEAVERLTAIARILRYGAAVAFLIVLGVAVSIVAATLQLAIYARRDELEIQKLVGATDRFVKAPFLLEGALQGFFGGTLAAIGLFGFFHFVGPRLHALLSFATLPEVQVKAVGVLGGLELLAAGAVLGLCGSFIAVGRFLRT